MEFARKCDVDVGESKDRESYIEGNLLSRTGR